MSEMRKALELGTRVQMESGSLYEIIGSPIGNGASGLIYPAAKLLQNKDEFCKDGITYVLKECYPITPGHSFTRSSNGQIVSEANDPAELNYLHSIQKMQLQEQQVSQAVYQSGFRILPVLESSSHVTLTVPGGDPVAVENTVTILESLSKKGAGLDCLVNQLGHLSALQAFSVTRQVLLALREIHKAGYLHLDISSRNVYLKGALEDGSDLITIIDFGSARPLIDGKTVPITDCAIYPSYGYAAPEIRMKNDGTLKLGPEADLYSVGCLLLFLLTGKQFAEAYLHRNRKGKYLSGWQLSRIDCPRHLVERMQTLIARALELCPENRYHAAEEMLRDVNDFLAALGTYRSDLKGMKYDAFICYKHSAVDSAVAKRLQQLLEHFHAPKGSSKTRRPFHRVFVDEGELASCVDYGEQIKEALRNSGWLIVVCSPDTPNSQWVDKEIQDFLEYHDRSRILAVMTSGEPPEIFPESLQGENEILAADARGSSLKQVLKRLRRDALLELAAPMLGVNLDALKQRRKMYVLQRVFAAAVACFLAVMSFTLYALNQNKKINAEHRSALISQYHYLAQQAMAELENQDPLAAVELALEAIPPEGSDLPVVPEAELALSKALNVYMTSSSALYSASPTGVYHQESVTSGDGFFLSSDRKILFSWTDSTIYLWDVDTYELIRSIQAEHYISLIDEKLQESDRNWLIYAAWDTLYCYDYANDCYAWTFSLEAGENILCAAVMEKGQTLLATNSTVCVLDAQGKLINSLTFQAPGEIVMGVLPVSSDGTRTALIYRTATFEGLQAWSDWDYYNNSDDGILLLDLNAMTWQSRDLEIGMVNSMYFVDNNQIAICAERGYQYRVIYENGTIEQQQNCEATAALAAWDTEELIWSQSFDCPVSTRRFEIEPVKGSGADGLLFYFADQCVHLDTVEGIILKQWTFGSNVVYLYQRNDGFNVVTADGCLNMTYFDQEYWYAMPLFASNLSQCTSGGGYFYVRYGKWTLTPEADIIRYDYARTDENWTCLTESIEYASTADRYAADGLCVVSPSEYLSGGTHVFYFHTQDAQDIREITLTDHTDCDIEISQILGVQESSQGETILLECTDACSVSGHSYRCLLMIDVQTGDVQIRYLPELPGDAWLMESLFTSSGIWLSGKIYPEDDGTQQLVLYFWNPVTDRMELAASWSDPASPNLYVYEMISDDAERYAALDVQLCGEVQDCDQDVVILVDRARGTAKPITDLSLDSSFESSIAVGADGQCAAIEQAQISVWDSNGQCKCIIARDDALVSVASCSFSPDGNLLVLYTNPMTLVKYSTTNGTEIARADLPERSLQLYDLSWHYQEDELILCSPSGICIVDCSDELFGLRAIVYDAFSYDETTDRFYTFDTSGTVGYFNRYPLSELIQMGQELIGQASSTD